MRKQLLTLLLILPVSVLLPAANETDRTRAGGPSLPEISRMPGVAPHELLGQMFSAMETLWHLELYVDAKQVDFRARLDADLPAAALDQRTKSAEPISFNLQLGGVATPNGRYKVKLEGDLGQVDIVEDLRRTFVSSQDFKSFSDTPRRARSKDANLDNYRSYFLRKLGELKHQILESGSYRSVYVGSGVHEGFPVHVLRVYKPSRGGATNKKAPMAINRMWTFWQDGGYEIWLYQTSKLPAVVFYTNVDDNIFANWRFDYDGAWMPNRISFQNNSTGAQGSGDVVFDFDGEHQLSGLSLKFNGDRGVSLRFDATLYFGSEPEKEAFRIIPPFGFKKINRDHLKLMLMTQISGGLLKLKRYGINFKNFKF